MTPRPARRHPIPRYAYFSLLFTGFTPAQARKALREARERGLRDGRKLVRALRGAA